MRDFLIYNPNKILQKAKNLFGILQSKPSSLTAYISFLRESRLNLADGTSPSPEIINLAEILYDQECRDLFKIPTDRLFWGYEFESFHERLRTIYLESALREFVLDHSNRSFEEKISFEVKRVGKRLDTIQEIVRSSPSGAQDYNARWQAKNHALQSELLFGNKVKLGPDIFSLNIFKEYNRDPWFNFFPGYEVLGFNFNLMFVCTDPEPDAETPSCYEAMALLNTRMYNLFMLLMHEENVPKAIKKTASNYLSRISKFIGMENHDYIHNATLKTSRDEFRKKRNSHLTQMEEACLSSGIRLPIVTPVHDEFLGSLCINHNYTESISTQANRDAWTKIFESSPNLKETLLRNIITALDEAGKVINYAKEHPIFFKNAGLEEDSDLGFYLAFLALKPTFTIMDHKTISKDKEYEIWDGKQLSITSALDNLGVDHQELLLHILRRHNGTTWLHNGTFDKVSKINEADQVTGFFSKKNNRLRIIAREDRTSSWML